MVEIEVCPDEYVRVKPGYRQLVNEVVRRFGKSRPTAELLVDAYIDSWFSGELTVMQEELLKANRDVAEWLESVTKQVCRR